MNKNDKPKICAVITGNNFETAARVERFVDLYEVRIDLIGNGWQEWANRLRRPWIACNRSKGDGGKWSGAESTRISRLLEAVGLGAAIVDIELVTGDLANVIASVKKSKAECLLSVHNLQRTPAGADLAGIVRQELAAGADICKVVTTANKYEDNLAVLQLVRDFPEVKLVAFAMGKAGIVSRVLSPLAGGYFTYASISGSAGSAPGQLDAEYLRSLYDAVGNNK